MNDTIPTELKEAYKEIIDSQRNSAVFFGDSTYELCYGFMHAAYTLGSEGKWISVEDRLPEDGEIILANGIGKRPNYCIFRDGKFERYVDTVDGDFILSIYFPDIKTWQPLPSQPQI